MRAGRRGLVPTTLARAVRRAAAAGPLAGGAPGTPTALTGAMAHVRTCLTRSTRTGPDPRELPSLDQLPQVPVIVGHHLPHLLRLGDQLLLLGEALPCLGGLLERLRDDCELPLMLGGELPRLLRLLERRPYAVEQWGESPHLLGVLHHRRRGALQPRCLPHGSPQLRVRIVRLGEGGENVSRSSQGHVLMLVVLA
jgi:hypothetical protein